MLIYHLQLYFQRSITLPQKVVPNHSYKVNIDEKGIPYIEESLTRTLWLEFLLSPYPGYIRPKRGFPLSFLSTFESGTLMLFTEYFSVAQRDSFQAENENQM